MQRNLNSGSQSFTKILFLCLYFWPKNIVMFSRGHILVEILDAVAMMTQTWVGKNCDAFMRANSGRNSQCHCYDDKNLGGKNSGCFHEVVLGTYRYTLQLALSLSFCGHLQYIARLSQQGVVLLICYQGYPF